MTRTFCQRCQKEHESVWGWSHQKWGINKCGSVIEGWGCVDRGMDYEFVPQELKEERVKFANDMVQPWRDGELSREYCELHPKQIKEMVKKGNITENEVKNAKDVWKKDIKGINT